MFNTLWRTVLLDDSAYQAWGERPNVFLRGIILIAIVTLIAGIIVFAVDLVQGVRPVEAVVADIEKTFDQVIGEEFPWSFLWQNVDPAQKQMLKEMASTIEEMVVAIVRIDTPLPRGITGLFEAVGAYLTRVLAAIGGWLFYGALVLIVVNLLGGTANLPDFLGMVSLYVIPGLLALFQPVPCLGGLLALIGTIWSIVVYIKAVSVASNLDTGKSILAVVAPFIVLFLLGILLSILVAAWLAILIPS